MAAIFFVKDGSGGQHVTSAPYDVSIEILSEKLADRELQYSVPAPRFNPEDGEAKWFGDYRYVVVETFDGEVSPIFQMPGYYHVVGLSPGECARMFGLE